MARPWIWSESKASLSSSPRFWTIRNEFRNSTDSSRGLWGRNRRNSPGARHGMPSFISKWVFQGNTSPLCLERYLTEVARTPFEVVVLKNDRHNYFLSCKKWAENLEAKRDKVVARWGRHLYRRFVLYPG